MISGWVVTTMHTPSQHISWHRQLYGLDNFSPAPSLCPTFIHSIQSYSRATQHESYQTKQDSIRIKSEGKRKKEMCVYSIEWNPCVTRKFLAVRRADNLPRVSVFNFIRMMVSCRFLKPCSLSQHRVECNVLAVSRSSQILITYTHRHTHTLNKR